MNRRVILDTSYLRGAQLPLLARLRRDGFRVAISTLALGELWARSCAEGNKGLLFSRCAKIAHFIDGTQPIVPGDGLLIHQLGGRFRDGRPPIDLAATEVGIRELWSRIAAGQMVEREWDELGNMLRVELDSAAADYTNMVAAARSNPVNKLSDDEEFRFLGRMATDLTEPMARKVSIPGGFQERFHGYARVVALRALHMLRNRPGYDFPVDVNDVEDSRLINHVASPGDLVACLDFAFLTFVDRSGTFQAPWVRTIGEILTDPLPPPQGWGRPARRFAEGFKRRGRAELVRLESECQE